MHYFLTGERGAGKSTALGRTLALLQTVPGGFVTYYGPDRRTLYLSPAGKAGLCIPDRAVAQVENGRPTAVPGAFDRLGPPTLTGASAGAGLLVMDECGRLEREALAFQRAVLVALDGSVPILGVIKPDRAGSWLEQIEGHRNVTILTVTEQNRDGLPKWLAGEMRDRG